MSQTTIIGASRRRLSPREASQLQGIPFDPFERAGTLDYEIYIRLGNAVNVGVVKLAAATLFQEGGESWGYSVQEQLNRLIA
jgi:site-specific DNA-cytosine methylase